MSSRFIPLGRIGRSFGLRGEVKVQPYNPRTAWFETAAGVWIEEPGEPRYCRVVSSRRHKEFFLLGLEGVRDRDQAEVLRGREILAPQDSLEPLAAGEYYWFQLIGLRVETEDGRLVGEVVRLEETAPEIGGNDVLVVRSGQDELLLPVAPIAVKEVDLAAGRIVVHAVPGLIPE